MLKIRLQRSGRKKRANYRIVVAEHSAPIQGRYIDLVGSYDPIVDSHGLKYDLPKIEEWIRKGAKPTSTVARLLLGSGVKSMEAYVVKMANRKVKNPKEVVEAPASTPTTEAPVKEVKMEPTAETKEETKKEETVAEVKEEESDEKTEETA